MKEFIILIPGMMCTKAVFSDQINYLNHYFNVQVIEFNRYDNIMSGVRDIASNLPSQFHLLGHSMGGAISLMLAARAPELVKGVILLDPVVFSSRFWLFAKVAFWLWPDRSKMVQSALRRPHHFDSFDAAFNFYRSKRAFSNIQDQGLWDYVNAAHQAQEDGSVTLRYSGKWEACVYRSPPSLWSTIGKLRKPLSVLAGRQSYVVLPSIADKLSSYPSLHFDWMDAGHLLPLEEPTKTAQWVTARMEKSMVN